MRGAIPPIPQYAFMTWCLVKHRDSFTFTLPPSTPMYAGTGSNLTIYLAELKRYVQTLLTSGSDVTQTLRCSYICLPRSPDRNQYQAPPHPPPHTHTFFFLLWNRKMKFINVKALQGFVRLIKKRVLFSQDETLEKMKVMNQIKEKQMENRMLFLFCFDLNSRFGITRTEEIYYFFSGYIR
jgi:hypothetical protein